MNPPVPTPAVTEAGTGKVLNVLGNAMTIRVHGRDTGGVVSVVESVDPAGGGTPPHIHHREDETFYILEGDYEFTCGGQTFPAGKGTTIFAPRGVPHCYRNVGSSAGVLLITLTPAGFEEFFEAVGALSPAEQEIPRILEIGEGFGLEIPPPPAS